MDVNWLTIPTLAALQAPESIWELRSNVHELLKNRTYVGKKMLNFLGASFLAPKSSHRCEKQPLLGRLGNTNQNQNEKYTSKKNLQDTATRSFISCCFILAFTSASQQTLFSTNF